MGARGDLPMLISAQARAKLKRANRSIWRRMVVVFKTGHLNNRKGPIHSFA
jgi:hypothetical protein